MKTEHPKTIKWFGLASIITIVVSFFIYYTANTGKLTKDEQLACEHYLQTKAALDSISLHLNKGKKAILDINQFAQVADKKIKK